MTVDARTREEPKAVLQEMEVHAQWISHFHFFNNLWFRAVRWAGPSYGNLLVFHRPAGR